MTRFATLIITSLWLCGCGRSPASPQAPIGADQPDDQVLKLFNGEGGWRPLAEPVHVEAFRVAPTPVSDTLEVTEAAISPAFAGYPIISGPVEVDSETASRLVRILADERIYVWDMAKGCEFSPGVGIRFVGSDGTTEILFCFSCDELMIMRNGGMLGHEDTDGGRAELIEVMQSIFPDDQVIQGLQPR